mgnify:CR=1 FL=1
MWESPIPRAYVPTSRRLALALPSHAWERGERSEPGQSRKGKGWERGFHGGLCLTPAYLVIPRIGTKPRKSTGAPGTMRRAGLGLGFHATLTRLHAWEVYVGDRHVARPI